jgi:hypothetical protein
MEKLALILLVVVLIPLNAWAQDYVLRSPSGKAEVRLRIAEKVYYFDLFQSKSGGFGVADCPQH